jgi:hypothetical protein
MAPYPLIVALACCALFGACMFHQAASPAELMEATANHMECLLRAARRIDDAISDAATIASITRPLCHAEFQEELRLVSRGQTQREQQFLEDRLGAAENGRAVVAVLRARVDRWIP